MNIIPDAALDADICTIAQKGAGKTYANRGLVERLLDAGRRVVVMDPLNSWWGLKAKADGTAGYPIVVIGGPNGDLPLNPDAGELLGETVAKMNAGIVIDVSDLKRGEMVRFSNAFLSALYRVNREALWLILEEADVFAPQNPLNDQGHLLHTVEQIARRGRARGFRLWSISQRPARLHKDVMSQASTLVLLRLRSPQDRGAAEDWVKGHAVAAVTREVIDSLASLKTGEGWVWSPDFDLLERVQFPAIRTLDTSFTPKPGEKRVAVKELAVGDLRALQAALAPQAADVAVAPSAGRVGPSEAEIEAIRKSAFAEGERAGFKAGMIQGENQGLKRAMAATHKLLGDFRAQHPEQFDREPQSEPPVRQEHDATRKAVAPPPKPKESGKISRAVQDIVAYYQAIYPRAVSFNAAAKAAGVGMRSSMFRTYEPELLTLGVVEAVGGGRYRALEKNGSPEEYLDRVDAQLSPKHQAIFRFIRRAGRPVSRDEIIVAAEVSPTSSTTSAALGLLIREADVVEQVGELYQLAEAYR